MAPRKLPKMRFSNTRRETHCALNALRSGSPGASEGRNRPVSQLRCGRSGGFVLHQMWFLAKAGLKPVTMETAFLLYLPSRLYARRLTFFASPFARRLKESKQRRSPAAVEPSLRTSKQRCWPWLSYMENLLFIILKI